MAITVSVNIPAFTVTVSVPSHTVATTTDTYADSAIDSALTITTSSLAEATEDEAYSVDLAATGGAGTYTWSLSSGTLQAGLTLSSSGTISGTPTATGTQAITVQVTDDAEGSDTQALSMVVNSATAPISLSTSSFDDGVRDESYSQTVTAAGGSESGYTWTATGLPYGLSIGASGTPSTSITGTSSQNGTFAVTINVTDSLGESVEEAINLTCNVPTTYGWYPTPPTASSPTIVTTRTEGTYLIDSDDTWIVATGAGGAQELRIAAGVTRVRVEGGAWDWVYFGIPADYEAPLASHVYIKDVISHNQVQATAFAIRGDYVDCQNITANGPNVQMWSQIEGQLGRQMDHVRIRDCPELRSRTEDGFVSESTMRFNAVNDLHVVNVAAHMDWDDKQAFRLHQFVSNVTLQDSTFNGAGIAFGTIPMANSGPVDTVNISNVTFYDVHNVGTYQMEQVDNLTINQLHIEVSADNPDYARTVNRYPEAGEDNWSIDNVTVNLLYANGAVNEGWTWDGVTDTQIFP